MTRAFFAPLPPCVPVVSSFLLHLHLLDRIARHRLLLLPFMSLSISFILCSVDIGLSPVHHWACPSPLPPLFLVRSLFFPSPCLQSASFSFFLPASIPNPLSFLVRTVSETVVGALVLEGEGCFLLLPFLMCCAIFSLFSGSAQLQNRACGSERGAFTRLRRWWWGCTALIGTIQ